MKAVVLGRGSCDMLSRKRMFADKKMGRCDTTMTRSQGHDTSSPEKFPSFFSVIV